MMNKKLGSFLSFLTTKKFIIPAALLIAVASVGGIVMHFTLAVNTNVKGINTFNIPAEMNIDVALINCEYNSASLDVKISKPKDGAEFFTNDKIEFSSAYTYKCDDTPKFAYSWNLDNSSKPFSQNKNSATLKNLTAGDHTVKYMVSDDKIKISKTIKFKVKNLNTVQCYQTCDSHNICANRLTCSNSKCVLESNPSSKECKPNQAPDWVSISTPVNGNTYETACDYQYSNYPCVSFVGNAKDPEDGNLSGNSLKWYYQFYDCNSNNTVYGSSVYFGSGNNPALFLGLTYCGKYKIILKATDSQGLEKTTEVEVTLYNSRRG